MNVFLFLLEERCRYANSVGAQKCLSIHYTDRE